MAVVIRFVSTRSAFACTAELRRLYTAATWGPIRVVRTAAGAELHLPEQEYGQVRELLERYGGSESAGEPPDPGRAARRRAAQRRLRARRMVERAEDAVRSGRLRLDAARERTRPAARTRG